MLSRQERKQILQLVQKKYRKTTGLFVAEGEKVVKELLKAGFAHEVIYKTDPSLEIPGRAIDVKSMEQITHFHTPSSVLGVFHLPSEENNIGEALIAVDAVRDPGNLGTIIRLCDWFGVSQLLCSHTTVDCFNPKVVQASMGSIARVHCCYLDLESHLSKTSRVVYGASADGDSLYEASLEKKGLYVFGSESHGISKEVSEHIQTFLSIPKQHMKSSVESLNVAVSVGIFLSEIFRREP